MLKGGEGGNATCEWLPFLLARQWQKRMLTKGVDLVQNDADDCVYPTVIWRLTLLQRKAKGLCALYPHPIVHFGTAATMPSREGLAVQNVTVATSL